MMKRTLVLMLTIILGLSCTPVTGYAEEDSFDFNATFQGAIILSLGSPNAVVDNTDTLIDQTNFNIVPLVKNNRTLLPLRFISESLGAQVAWDSKTSTATIKATGKSIKVTLGSSKMFINGKSFTLDAPAQYKEGRVFIPLRAVSEAFGKKVFFDRGIIVVSNTTILNAKRDREIVDYLKFVLAPYSKDPYTGKTLSTEQVARLEQSVVMLDSYDKDDNYLGFGSAISIGYGLFLTNYHVIADSSSYMIQTSQDQYYEVQGVVAADENLDLAIVKTSMRTNIPPLHAGLTTKITTGQPVVAIGNPEGLQNTISTGIISGIRNYGGERLIQTTTPITNGSSGGPLLNMKGEVIGVNTMGIEKGDLNFAIPIDYASRWIKKYTALSFSSIPVLNQDQFRETAVTEQDPTVEQPSTVSQNVHLMGRTVREATLDPAQSVIFAIDENQSTIFAYRYADNKVLGESTAFSTPPRKLLYANGEIYVIFSNADYSSYRFEEQQGGQIVVLEADTLKIKDQWDTRIDPYEIEVDHSGHVYVNSGSGQWTSIISYDRATKKEISSATIRQGSHMVLHPSEDRIYAVDSDTSPRDIEMFRLMDGKFSSNQDSPYHGEYKFSTVIGITPDGKYVLNGAGTVLSATNNSASNMQYATAIDLFDYVAVHSAHKEIFFTGKDRMIKQYDTETLKVTGTRTTKGTILKLFMSDKQLIAITKITLPGNPLPQYAIETVKDF
ncbi:stalk domain-containing protein [Paenibacillus amylolyticus]|uniref:stalk domain-containing protein n=1 Tax=Paenibacillus amylolyticus TaxID=1451 RepID=UPI00201D78D3|nr:stalk domain-containing protein [Paenibacillus amylolyticus]MCL6658797.1 stalk domain-containing protein [Paenibacillus amylolyticus]